MSIEEKIKKEHKKRKVKGILITILFHFLLLVLLSFMSLEYQDPPPERGIPIKFEKEEEKILGDIEETGEDEDAEEEEEKVVEEEENNEEENEEKVVEEEENNEEENEEKVVEEEENNEEENEDKDEEKLTLEEKKFDKNGDGELNEEEIEAFKIAKKFKESIKRNKEYKENKENWYNLWNGKSKGNNGKKIGEAGNDRKARKADYTLDCPQNKGTGKMSVVVVIDADGNIVEIYEDSFKSTITGLANANKKQKKKLFECIKEKYKVTPATGEDKSDKLYFLELDFKN